MSEVQIDVVMIVVIAGHLFHSICTSPDAGWKAVLQSCQHEP